ncbi:MAG: MATE family efflux transporter [Candidatus Enterenecus sp.]
MEQQTQSAAYLGQTPIGKLLPKFSVPCVMSLLVSALYNIVDQIFIGQSAAGYLGNAATNVVYPFTVVALALALLVGDGAAALLSLSQGRGDDETGRRAVGSAITLSVIIGVVLAAVGLIFMEPILSLFGVTANCHDFAVQYMRIICLGIPFYIITNGLNASIRADGAPTYAMVSTVVGAVINLVCDPIAIFVLDWGVAGAAWATILGQVVTAVLALIYFRKPKTFRLTAPDFVPRASVLAKTLSIGLPSLIIQMAIVIIMTVSNTLIGIYGPQSVYGPDIPLAVIGIVMKVFGIVVAIAIGIALGGQPIIGYSFGAGDGKRVFKVYRYILVSVLVVGLIAMAIFELCPQIIIALFGSEGELYNEFAELCFRVLLSGIALTCIQKASSIFLQSLGKPGQSTLVSLARDVIFFVPTIIIFARAGGITAMLWAAPVADVLSVILAFALIIPLHRKYCKNGTPAGPVEPAESQS